MFEIVVASLAAALFAHVLIDAFGTAVRAVRRSLECNASQRREPSRVSAL